MQPKDLIEFVKTTDTFDFGTMQWLSLGAYIVVNLFLLVMCVRLHLWSYIPTSLFGLIVAMFIQPSRSGLPTCIYQILLSFVLLNFALALEDVYDPAHTDLFRWSGDPLYLSAIANLAMRGGTIFAANVAILRTLPEIHRVAQRVGALPDNADAVPESVVLRCLPFVIILMSVCGFICTFAHLEKSHYLALAMDVSASLMFVLSLAPVVWLGRAQGANAGTYKVSTTFLITMMCLRMILLASITGTSMTFTFAVLVLLMNHIYILSQNTPFRYFGSVVGIAQGLSYIVFAVLLNAQGVAFIGVVCCYTALGKILLECARDGISRAIMVTVLGLATIHFGLAFQEYYGVFQDIVMRLVPRVMLDFVDTSSPSGKVVNSYEPMILNVVRILKGIRP